MPVDSSFQHTAHAQAPHPHAPLRSFASPWLACAAIALPNLLAFNLPPSATFLNQAAALIGWGSWLILLAASITARDWPRTGPLAALQAALAVVLVAAIVSPLWTGLPWSLALSGAGLVAASMLAAQVGAALRVAGHGRIVFRAFCIGLVVACVGSTAVGIVQVYAPQWADGNLIARSGIVGRAVGNMRQPNHLSSLLLWGVIAAVWLGDARVLQRWLSTLIGVLLIFGVVLSGSRTGAVGMGVLAVWGLLDRRLSREARWLLVLAPVIYGAFWFGASAWADHSHNVFGGEKRFSTKGDISSSRYGIWSNTVSMIRMHPWLGVGFGEFNFAWTLTPFPGRPVAFFDHTHNLPLQLAVELGLPLAVLVMVLLTWALYQALQRALKARHNPDATEAPLLRAAFMMVLMILVHSQLEYPLWYAYFLFPAAFAFGLCLARPTDATPTLADPTVPERQATRPLLLGAMVLVLGGIGSVADYLRVVVIFQPPANAAPLGQRIDEGRQSVFFAHHADYAAATTSDRPSEVMFAFVRAPHYLLDSRLMMAWAKALDEAGDTEHARYIAQRLKEFRNEQAEPFFAVCDAPPAAVEAASAPAPAAALALPPPTFASASASASASAAEAVPEAASAAPTALPFQCMQPKRAFDYGSFR